MCKGEAFSNKRQASALTEQEREAVIEIASPRNQRAELKLDAAYFRGCCDDAGYLEKLESYNKGRRWHMTNAAHSD